MTKIKGLEGEDEGTLLIHRKARGIIYEVDLPDSFESTAQYGELRQLLRRVGPTDGVVLYIHSFGGSCHAGQGVINAMADCDARVTCIVDQPSYSMGSLIALAGDHLVMHTDTFLMFHNYSSTASGKGGELMDSVHRSELWLRNQQRRVCYPFLSNKELKLLEQDRDVTIHWDDKTLPDRVTRHFEYQRKNRVSFSLDGG